MVLLFIIVAAFLVFAVMAMTLPDVADGSILDEPRGKSGKLSKAQKKTRKRRVKQ